MDLGRVLNHDPQALQQLMALIDALESEDEGPLDAGPDGTWERERHAERPRTLQEAMLRFKDWESETRFTPEEFEYLIRQLGVPLFLPTDRQRRRSKM